MPRIFCWLGMGCADARKADTLPPAAGECLRHKAKFSHE